jgi:hypothetical protein
MLNDIYEILRKQITWLYEKRETMISQSTQRKLKREYVRHKKKIGDVIWCGGGNFSSNITITTTVA